MLVVDAVAPRTPRPGTRARGRRARRGGRHGARLGARRRRRPARAPCACPPPTVRACGRPGRPPALLQAGILLATAAALALLHDGGRGPRDTTVTTALLLAAATGGAGVAAARDIGTWLVTLELATVPVVALVAMRGTRVGGPRRAHPARDVADVLRPARARLGALAHGDRRRVVRRRHRRHARGPTPSGGRCSSSPSPCCSPGSASSSRSCRSTPGPRRPTPPPTSAPPLALAAASKIAALAALLVVAQALVGAAVDATPVTVVVGVLAVASMLLGNVMALRQDDATRLLAWSTVAQAGWVVLPVAALQRHRPAGERGLRARLRGRHGSSRSRRSRSWGRVRSRAPAASCAVTSSPAARWACALLVLAGLPPGIIGLVAKVVALRPAVEAGPLAARARRGRRRRARHRGLPAVVRAPRSPTRARRPGTTAARTPAAGRRAAGAPASCSSPGPSCSSCSAPCRR